MKTINFKFHEFNLEKFISDYDSKIRLILGINKYEPIGRIIEVLEHNTFNIKFLEEPFTTKQMLEKIESEEIAIFMPLGIVGDRNSKYLRLINMYIYRIEAGATSTLYENSEKFEMKKEILDTGDLKVDENSTIGIVITKVNNKVFISFAQYECGSCLNTPMLTVKENTGKLSKEIKDYLYDYKIC